MSANIKIESEITEISIDHDAYSDLRISIKQHEFKDQLKFFINDLVISLDDSVALEILHGLAEHYKYKLVDEDA